MRTFSLFFCVLVLSSFAQPSAAQGAKAGEAVDTQKLLKTIDERLTSPGDLKLLGYLSDFDKGSEKPRETVEVVVYRRDSDDSLLLLMLAPKTRAGEGYLRLAENLFWYVPATGKWSRTTLRHQVAESQMRTADVDDTHFARDFSARYVGLEKLGNYQAHHLALRANDSAKVPYSRVDVFIDTKTGDLLKRIDSSDDGKMQLRTVYFRGWQDHVGNGNARVRWPTEIHFLDHLMGRRTSFYSKKVSLEPLEPNQFTKAWLESKSR